jgi:SET domain-containing protein
MPNKKYKHNSPFSLSVKRSAAGLGVFADEAIKKGQFILDYSGKMISEKQAQRIGGRYLFEINSRWTIDGRELKNLSRYLNHSCRPNCEPKNRGKRIVIYSIKDIAAGEELTYDYGQEYFDAYIKPHGCRCQKCSDKKHKKK